MEFKKTGEGFNIIPYETNNVMDFLEICTTRCPFGVIIEGQTMVRNVGSGYCSECNHNQGSLIDHENKKVVICSFSA